MQLMQGMPAKINLIPFNPWPGSPYVCSDWKAIEVFAAILNRAAIPLRSARPGAATSSPRAVSSNPRARSCGPARGAGWRLRTPPDRAGVSRKG